MILKLILAVVSAMSVDALITCEVAPKDELLWWKETFGRGCLRDTEFRSVDVLNFRAH